MAHERTPRCGRISYTNDLPVYAAFDLGAIDFPGSLHPGVPAQLNRKLLAGELDISPISSVVYAQHMDHLLLLTNVCIAAPRAVRSICCVSPVPIGQLAGQPIAVTKESATGRALFEVICREAHGFAPAYVESDRPFDEYQTRRGACLLIGDAAIDASFTAPARDVYDAGLLWHELSGYGMVYAFWAARKNFAVGETQAHALQAVEAALESSLQWGYDHRPDVVALAQRVHGRPQGFYEHYFAGLQFELDVRVMEGFNRFLQLAGRFGLLAPVQVGLVTQ